jgi:hypothetical protein
LPNLEPKVLGFFVGRIHGRRNRIRLCRGALGIGYIGAPAETSEEKSSEGALTAASRTEHSWVLLGKEIYSKHFFISRIIHIFAL